MITRLISKAALQLILKRNPDFVIGPPEDPYMLRWWWIPRNRFLNVYVHVFKHDDDDRVLHDHPWSSLSLMVRGQLIEEYKEPEYVTKRLITEGKWIYRKAEFAHRLIVPTGQLPPVTVFIIGPRVRQWGFHCPKGWRHWKDFAAPDSKGTIGRGCGDME